MKRTLTVSEELGRKGITPLKVNPLKVSVGMSSELLREEGHNVAEAEVMIKAVLVEEEPIIGLVLMVAMDFGLWKKLI